MLLRVGARVAALAFVLGCGRSGLELDDIGTGGASGRGSAVGGAPGAGTAGAAGGSGGGAGERFCPNPSFSSNVPDDGSVDVSTTGTVSVGFVCPEPTMVDPATVSLAVVSAVGAVDGTTAWDAVLGRLTFTPSAPLALATRYTAVASSPIGDLSWSFWTTDGAWQPPEEVGRGGDVVLGLSPDGFGILAFHQGGEVSVRRFTIEDGLVRDGEVLTESPIVPRSLRVGVASGGTAFAVWGAPGGDIRGASETLDGGWARTESLDPLVGAAFVEDFALAGDGTGIALTSVRAATEQPGMLRAIAVGPEGFGAATTLSSVVPLDTVRATARPGGRSWAVWSSWGETGRVLGRHAGTPGAFGPELVVGEPVARAGFAAMSNDDAVFVVWQDGSPPNAVMATRLTPARESEQAVPLDTRAPGLGGVPTSGVYARVAADHLGRAMAMWVNQAKTTGGVIEQVRSQRYEGGWADRHVALSGSTVGEWAVISPTGLILDRHGNGFAGFGHGSPARAWVSRFRDGFGWEPAAEVATSATAPLVAVDASGRAAIAWASDGRVYLRRFIDLTAPPPRH